MFVQVFNGAARPRRGFFLPDQAERPRPFGLFCICEFSSAGEFSLATAVLPCYNIRRRPAEGCVFWVKYSQARRDRAGLPARRHYYQH